LAGLSLPPGVDKDKSDALWLEDSISFGDKSLLSPEASSASSLSAAQLYIHIASAPDPSSGSHNLENPGKSYPSLEVSSVPLPTAPLAHNKGKSG